MAKNKNPEFREVDNLPFDGEVEKKYVPEGYESIEDYLKNLREEYEADLQADEMNRREAITDLEFAAGQQWDPRVLQAREGLPCLTINTIPQFTAQLVGDWRQNKASIKVLPAEDGDQDVANIRADLIRSIEYKSRADRVYANAFESQVTCGDGAFRVSVDYAKDDVFDQELGLNAIDDPLSVIWDRFSIDPTGKDATRCFVEDRLSRKELKKKWKDADPSTLGDRFGKELSTTGWVDNDSVKVVEHWRMIERDRLIGLFPDGAIRHIEADNLEEITTKHGAPVKLRRAPCLYAQMHLVTGFAILDGPYEYKLNRLPIIRMMGRTYNVEGKRIRYGLVRNMKDSARLRNFWRSVAAEQLGYAPKAQWIAPESAVEGREEAFRRAHLSRDPLLVYNDGAEAPPERIPPPTPEMALLNEAQINSQDMKDVTGIHDASLGIKSNETSGKAIMARQREGDVASLTYYDNGNASILEAGDVLNQLISQIYDSTRIIRIVGEDEAARLVRINDPNDPSSPNLAVGGYDVAITTGASFTTRRAEAAEAMMNAVQVWPQLIQVAGDIIAKAQDWPGADKLADRLKKTIPPQFLDPEDQQEGGQAPQIDPEQMQSLFEDYQKTKEELAQLKADREIEWYNAETQRIRALSDNMVDGNDIELNAISEILAHERAEKDREAAMKQASRSSDSGS
jgi:hypothetical protein